MAARLGGTPAPKPKGKGKQKKKPWGNQQESTWKNWYQGYYKKSKGKSKGKGKGKRKGKGKGTKGKGQRRNWGYGQPWQTYDLQQYQDPREVQPAQAPAPTPVGQQSRKIQKQCKFFAKGNCKHAAAGTECPFLHGTP